MKLFIVVLISFIASSSSAQQDSLIQPEQRVKFNNDSQYKTSENKPSLKAFVVPGILIGYGFTAINNHNLKALDNNTKLELREDHPLFMSKLDNYLQYSPAAAVFGLNAFGIKGKNSFRDRSIIYALSTVLSAGFTVPLKKITRIERPDGSGFNSFPSGHTITAFAAAEFLRMEYKDVSPWYGVAGYAVATATGVLRLYNNKHWVSDVVAGAGFGMLSTKLAYWVYPSIKKRFFKNKAMHGMVMPYYQNGRGGIAFVYKP